MWRPPILETERLILRDLRASDAQDVFDYGKRPNVSEFTLWEKHNSIEDSLSYINIYAGSNYSNGEPEPFAIELKENGKMIGCAGAFWVSKKNRMMELAYVISDDYWGRGIVAEASQAVLDYCFKLYGIERMQCRCKVGNDASFRVMEKLGFSYEGTLRKAIYHRERFWDMKYTSLLFEDWRKSQKSRPFVRRARHGDEEGIHKAHMKSIKEVCSKDYTQEQINAWGGREFNFEQKRKLIDNQYMWVVEDQGIVEGYGLLWFYPENHEKEGQADIGGLYLTPKVLGRGLGKEIVFYIKEMAKVVGVSEVYLSSTKTSKKFYESQGFKQYEKDDVSMIGGVPVEGHPMKVKL